MVVVKRNILLNMSGELPAAFLSLVSELNLEIREGISSDQANTIVAIVVADPDQKLVSVVEKYETVIHDIPLISFKNPVLKSKYLALNGKAILNEDYLKEPSYRQMVKRLLGAPSSIHLKKSQDETSYDSIVHIAQMNAIQTGVIADNIAAQAYNSQFSPIAVREYFEFVSAYASYLNKSEISNFPVDWEFGHDDTSFIVQASFRVNSFVYEYLTQALSARYDPENPFRSLLSYASEFADHFDIFYLENASRLVITGTWYRAKRRFSSFIASNIVSFESIKDKSESSTIVEREIEDLREELVKSLIQKDLPGEYANVLLTGKNTIGVRPLLLKDIIDHIKNRLSEDDFNRDISTLVVRDVKRFLEDYSDQQVIKDLIDSDYDAILAALLDPHFSSMFEKGMENIFMTYDEDESVQSDYLNDLSVLMSSIDIDDLTKLGSDDSLVSSSLTNIIEGVTQKIEEDRVIVSGVTDLVDDNYSTVVSGGEVRADDSVTVIKGVTDKLKVDNEVWKVRRDGVIAQSQKIIAEARASGRDLSGVFGDFATILESNLGINSENALQLVSKIFEKNAEKMVAIEVKGKIDESINSIPTDSLSSIEVQQLRSDLKKSQSQLSMMRLSVENLGIELETSKKTNEYLKGNFDASELEEKEKIEKIVQKYERDIQKKMLVIQRLKEQKGNQVSELNEKLVEAEEKNNVLAEKNVDSIDGSVAASLEEFRNENQSLKNLLEVSNRRITVMSDTINELKTSGPSQDNSFEMSRLREKHLEVSNELDNQLKINGESGVKLKRIETAFVNLKSMIAKQHKASEAVESRDVAQERIEQLNVQLQVKDSKIANLKSESLKIEQDLRKTKKELADFISKNADQGSNGSAQQVDHKIKQLEMMNEKLSIVVKKSQEDMAQAKKDAHEFKSENVTLKNKCTTLEKKIERLQRNKAA